MSDKHTFMDEVHSATFNKKVGKVTLGDESIQALTKYRINLRKAERYIIDDDAVRLVCHLSQEKSRLEAWSFLARTPHDVFWMEMDLHTKCREFDKMGVFRSSFDPKDVSKDVGYLFFKDGGGESRWICHEFKRLDDSGDIVPGLIAFVFDPEGGDHNKVTGSIYWKEPTLSLLPGMKMVPAQVESNKGLIVGDIPPEFCLAGDLYKSKSGVNVNTWFENRGAVIMDPYWKDFLRNKPQSQINQILTTECLELAGAMRYIVTMLSAINSLPKDVKPVQTKVGYKPQGKNILPYMQHHIITLKIPNDNKVVWARQHLEKTYNNQPRPWHSVRGHWRVVEKGKVVPGRICRHSPTIVDNGLGICTKCELIVRWIKDHSRGDPNVGIVQHTYKVKAA